MLRLLSLRLKRNISILAIAVMFIVDFNLILSLNNNIFINYSLILISLIPMSTLYEKVKILNAGIKGENKAHSYLKLFETNGYRIAHNVIIPKKGDGFREIDFVLIGPMGVFIIEAKNISGCIKGYINDRYLNRIRKSKGGKLYNQQISNPIYQLKGQIITLDNILKRNNIECFVDGLVLFTNKNVELDVPDNTNRLVIPRNQKEAKIHIYHSMLSIFDLFLDENINYRGNNKALSKSEIDNIYNLIEDYSKNSLEVLKGEIKEYLTVDYIINNLKNKFNLKNKKEGTLLKDIINSTDKLIVIIERVTRLIKDTFGFLFISLFCLNIFNHMYSDDSVFAGFKEIFEALLILIISACCVYIVAYVILKLLNMALKGANSIFAIIPKSKTLNSNHRIKKEYENYNLNNLNNININNDMHHKFIEDEINRILMGEDSGKFDCFDILNESAKAVTPFDEGGYLQGPGFNPSDTDIHRMQDMF